MKIYTRTGDKGKTGLFGGPRVDKDDVRIEAYGAVDELNAFVGLARTTIQDGEKNQDGEMGSALEQIQNDLFAIGAELATPDAAGKGTQLIELGDVKRLEDWIDAFESKLAPLTAFILPGGGALAAHLHVCRTTCRRAERRTWTLAKHSDVGVSAPLTQYLNRLSDLLFVLARAANLAEGMKDTPWKKPPDSSQSSGGAQG